jgi:hypothetical protein
MSRRLFVVAMATVAIAIAAVAPAWAGGPDTGRYDCYHYGSYFAYFTLKANGKYTFNGQGTGNWVYKPKSRKVVFKTGPIPPWYGKRIKDYQGHTQIELHKGSGDLYAICY